MSVVPFLSHSGTQPEIGLNVDFAARFAFPAIRGVSPRAEYSRRYNDAVKKCSISLTAGFL
jgi:hypothetical protein